MNIIEKIPFYQRKKNVPKPMQDLKFEPFNEAFGLLTKPFLSNDDLRPMMMGNNFNSSYESIVGTNAHILYHLYSKGLKFNGTFLTIQDIEKMYKKSGLDATFTLNDYVDKFGEVEKSDFFDKNHHSSVYPKWELIIPTTNDYKNEIDIQKLWWFTQVLCKSTYAPDLLNESEENKAFINNYHKEEISYVNYQSFFPESKKGFKGRYNSADSSRTLILRLKTDNGYILKGFNCELLLSSLKFLLSLGYNEKTTFTFTNEESRGVLFDLSNISGSDTFEKFKSNYVLLMPTIIKDGFFKNSVISEENVEIGNNQENIIYDVETNSIWSEGEFYEINEKLGFTPLLSKTKKAEVKKTEPITPKKNDNLVGSFYFDTRKDKTFKIVYSDNDKIQVQYYDRNKKEYGDLVFIQKDEFNYYTQMGAWGKYTQPYFDEPKKEEPKKESVIDNDNKKGHYRIHTKDGKIKFAGTGIDSWFNSINEAREHLRTDKGETLYEYSNAGGEPMWEVLVTGFNEPKEEPKIENLINDEDIFDVTKIDLDKPINSKMFRKGIDKEIEQLLSKQSGEIHFDFKKNGNEWTYKNTIYNVKDEDLLDELKLLLELINRSKYDLLIIEKELPKIQSRYGKDANFSKKFHQEAKDFYSYKLQVEKSIRANEVFKDYLVWRLKELNKSSLFSENKTESKSETIIDKKIKVLNLMLLNATDSQKELINKKLKLLALMNKNSFSNGGIIVTDYKHRNFIDGKIFKKGSGILIIGKHNSKRPYSVVQLFVDEKDRRKGIATDLIKYAEKNFEQGFISQVSNEKSLMLHYKLGFKSLDNDLKEEDYKASLKKLNKNTSVAMASPNLLNNLYTYFKYEDGGKIDSKLVALHNIYSDEIISANKIGGLITPSIAILRAGEKFTDFGNITLIPKKELINPKNYDVKVFSGDVYSPTVPRKLFYVDSKKYDKITNDIVSRSYQNYDKDKKEIYSLVGNILSDYNNFYKDLSRSTFDSLIKNYEDELKIVYIVDKSIPLKVPMKESKHYLWNNFDFTLTKEQKKRFDKVLTEYSKQDNVGKPSEDIKSQVYDLFVEVLENVKSDLKEKYKNLEQGDKLYEILTERIDETFKSYIGTRDSWSDTARYKLSNAVYGNQILDKDKLNQNIKRIFTKSVTEDYKEWLSDFISQFRGSAYFLDGNKKMPYTLDNLVDATAYRTVGQEKNLTFGVNQAKSFSAKQFKSLEEIKKYSDKLISKEEMNVVDESNKDNFFKLSEVLKYEFNDTWGKLDALGRALADYYKGNSVESSLRKNDFKAPSSLQKEMFIDFAKELKDSPVDYFEAKLGRAVKLNEFDYAIVPFNTNKETLEVLKQNGLKVKRYKTDEERVEMTNSVVFKDKNLTFAKGGLVEDLISKGIVELKMFDTKPEHAKEYGLDSKKPLYVQTICVSENERLKGIGNKVLQYIDDYAIKNGHDVVFGHITQKAQFSNDNRQTFFCDIDMIKNWLHSNGYTINDNNNDFYKLVDNHDVRFSGGGLIAPNGKPSNLTPEQYKLVRTPEFKAWFGDWENDPKNASKVVDENGEPLVVYHGTKYDFSVFDKKRIGENYVQSERGGFFFTQKKQTAENYAKLHSEMKSKGFVYECFLSIKKPIIKTTNSEYYAPADRYDINRGDYISELFLNKSLDGIIISGTRKDNLYVALKPNQIKLANGTNTTFDGSNPDIRFKDGGLVDEKNYLNTVKSCLIAQNYSDSAKGVDIYEDELHYKQINKILNKDWLSYSDIKDLLYEEKNKFIEKAISSAKKINLKVVIGLDYKQYEVVYFEFPFGQVSFHLIISENSLESLLKKHSNIIYDENYKWSGLKNSGELLREELDKINNPDIRFKDGGSVDEKKLKSIDVVSVLNLAQIPFDRKTSINGSEYWNVLGQHYRISDHEKPSGYTDYSNTINFYDFNSFYDFLKKEHDLTDKSKIEIDFKNDNIKNIESIKHKEYGTVYQTKDKSQFGDIDSALNYLWNKYKEKYFGNENSFKNGGKTDSRGNYIGDSSFQKDYEVFEFPDYPQIESSVSKSQSSESVYVTYTDTETYNSITVRFSNHQNNAVKFGEQLNGSTATKKEVLARLGLIKRIFVPEKRLFIAGKQVKKVEIPNYEQSNLTIKELYGLGNGADISEHKGKLAKNSNFLIQSDKVSEVNTGYGNYIYPEND